MAGGKYLYVNRRTRPYYSRRCKTRSSPTNIESLPDELVFNILLQLSTRDIYDVARFVCRKWYGIVHTDNFINAQLQHSTSGLIVQSLDDKRHPIFLTMQQGGRVEISNFSYKFDNVWPGCNGLIVQYVLLSDDLFNTEYFLYIANPATKQLFALPPLPRGSSYQGGIAFASTSMQYKVVCAFNMGNGAFNKCNDARCVILTVGVDNSWRPICTQHLSPKSLESLIFIPHVTDGFMHWPPWSGTHFLTLNIETEIITETCVPQVLRGEKFMHLLSSGRYLTLLVDRSYNCLWEVWEMQPKIGEWTKLQNIDLEPHKCTFQKFMSGSRVQFYPAPKGWLKYKEVLIFSIEIPKQVLFTFNVRTQEFDEVELGIPTHYNYNFFGAHRSSLVGLGGCKV